MVFFKLPFHDLPRVNRPVGTIFLVLLLEKMDTFELSNHVFVEYPNVVYSITDLWLEGIRVELE